MLAHTIKDTAKVEFPVFTSQKFDGIRCLIIDGVAVSRTLKPIRNEYVQSIIGNAEFNGLDGELIVGSTYAHDCYRVTNSGVMSKDGEPDFKYYVFDRWDSSIPYMERYASLHRHKHKYIEVVVQSWAYSEGDLLHIENKHLELGAEGVMVRSLNGPYKQGRSTLKEGTLGKLKRFVDDEYEVIDFEERMHNENEATLNELGYTERSSHKDNKTGRGDLGALVLRTREGLVFRCGTGFDDDSRRSIWDNKDNYLGKFAKVKSFSVGVKDAPRFPVFLGFRSEEDI